MKIIKVLNVMKVLECHETGKGPVMMLLEVIKAIEVFRLLKVLVGLYWLLGRS